MFKYDVLNKEEKMKKLVVVVALLGVVASFVVATAEPEEDVTLTYWTWHPAAEVLQPVLEMYEAENEGVTIELSTMESTVYQERLPVVLASEEELDVFGVQTGVMPAQLKGYMSPLDDYFAEIAGSDWEDIFNPLDLGIARSQTETDELLFITIGRYGSAVGLYNVAIFEELGLDVPVTYEEFKSVAEVIRTEMPDIIPVSFTGDGWFQDEMVLTIVAQQSDLFNEIRYGDGRWDDPRYVEALEDYKRLFDDGVFLNMGDVAYGRSAELFDTGQAAMFFQGTWEAPRLSAQFREARGIGLDNVGAMAFPIMREGGKATLRAFTELGLATPVYSDHKEEAADLIYWLSGGSGLDVLNESLFLVTNKLDSAFPDAVFDSDEGRDGWDLVVDLVVGATSHRNNMSGFSNVLGQFIQLGISGEYGDDMAQLAADIQAEYTSGKYDF